MSWDIGGPVTAQTEQAGRQLDLHSNTLEVADLTTMRKWKLIIVNGCERSHRGGIFELVSFTSTNSPACFEMAEISSATPNGALTCHFMTQQTSPLTDDSPSFIVHTHTHIRTWPTYALHAAGCCCCLEPNVSDTVSFLSLMRPLFISRTYSQSHHWTLPSVHSWRSAIKSYFSFFKLRACSTRVSIVLPV